MSKQLKGEMIEVSKLGTHTKKEQTSKILQHTEEGHRMSRRALPVSTFMNQPWLWSSEELC